MSDENMVPLTDLRAKLRYEFPEVPIPLIDDAIICAAQRITSRPLLQIDIDLTPQIQQCEPSYDLARHLPEDTKISGIVTVKHCGCCIDPIPDKCDPCPCGWRMCDMTTIEVHPAPQPNNKDTLEVCVSLTPTNTACRIPAALYEEFYKPLRDFARAEIMSTPNTSFTNLSAARNYTRQARAAVRTQSQHLHRNMKHSGIKAVTGRKWLVGNGRKARGY